MKGFYELLSKARSINLRHSTQKHLMDPREIVSSISMFQKMKIYFLTYDIKIYK